MDNTQTPDQIQNPMPPIENKPPMTTVTTENPSSIGGIISIIIVIAVIILGGLYFWGKRVEETKIEEPTRTESTDQQASAVNSTNSSDSIDDIRADLNATQTTNLDPELR